MSANSSVTLTGLPTELLIRIFAHLPLDDLLSVQHTCRRFCGVISGSTSLQYFLRTEINLLEDQAPDLSLHDRVAFLKHHESAWNHLQFNEFTRFSTEASKARYILQDGYLIYNAVVNPSRYGYIDLYSSLARPHAEAPWTHISLEALHPLSDIVFAVDLNLVVAISKSGQDGFPEASFLEFTTGAPHPLSLVNTVSLPRKTEVQVLGDYILVTAKCESCGHSNFFAVSWKTGTATQLYRLCGSLKVVVIDPDNSLIALIKSVKSATNTIRICKLKFASGDAGLDTLCYLRLPGSPFVPMSGMEWIPTSKRQDKIGFEKSRGRLFPFRSYRAGTIWLVLSYRTRDGGVRQYSMFVSIGALLSVAHSGVHAVPWANWGPACTRILPLNSIFPQPAGPFWITSYAPLVVCDYDTLRARYIKKKKKSTRMSSVPSMPSLGPPSTKLFGEHWTKGEVKTHLPFRKFVASGVSLQRVVQVVADREWVVVISLMGKGGRTPITVYHVG
ncbi:hypothetical protein EDB86DRAFT_2988864 [Lactarius hatsudake]|nr:hypothetical protein EDB86DRAFT_2988864 [Lactarius hatsudake]